MSTFLIISAIIAIIFFGIKRILKNAFNYKPEVKVKFGDETEEGLDIQYNFPEVIIELPQLPDEFDRPIKIKSFSEPKLFYELNLYKYTCTCPDFEDRRIQFAMNNPQRLCKHLLQAIYERKKIQKFFDPIEHYFLTRYRKKQREKLTTITLVNNEKLGIVWMNNKEWIDILEQNETGSVQKYGYNFFEKRWSYGTKPINYKAIETTLRAK